MKKLILGATLVIALQVQTPAQVIDQISNLLQQLKTSLTEVVPSSGDELTAALKVGGRITLKAGTTYVGNFVISQPTTLVGGDPLTTVLAPKDVLQPTLQISANDVRVSSLQLTPPAPDRETLVVGDPNATSSAAQPQRVVLAGLTMRAPNGGHRGIALHGIDVTVDRCNILNYYEKYRDSQGIAGWNGPGPYTITNNTIEASGENILFGGADPATVGVIPSNILVQGNILRKPDSFRTLGTVKNSFELKNAKHVKVLNNVIEGWWHDGQDAPVQFTTRNQGGKCTWCQVDDVVFSGNVLKTDNAGFGVNILGQDDTSPSVQTNVITIDHNLFQNSIRGVQVLNGVAQKLTIDHNTFPNITDKMLSWATAGGKPKVMTPLVFTQNVLKTGAYGITGEGTTVGLISLQTYATVLDFTGNVIEMTNQRNIALPSGNTIVAYGGLAALLDPTTFKLLNGTAGY